MSDMNWNRWWEGKTIYRGTPCPDCGKTMMYCCTFTRLYDFASAEDPGNWEWRLHLDRERSECECFHTLNVERWESERVRETLPWPPVWAL